MAKKRYKITALLLVVVLCLSLLAACGEGSGDQPGTDPQPSQSQTPAPSPSEPAASEPVVEEPVSGLPEPTGTVYDLYDYLWDLPVDATDEEYSKYAVRNFKFVQSIEPLVSEESYFNLYGASVRLKQNRDGAREDFAAALAALDLKTSVADGVYFLWDADNMPMVDGESFTEEELDNGPLDGYGFIPLLVKCLLDDPTTAKGNIILVSGGAMTNRSNAGEAYPAISVFNDLGYNVFVLQRRIRPYSDEDIYMDMQRSVRVVRYYAEQEGWGGQDMIAAAGWSGGAMTIMGAVSNLYGDLNPTKYDSDYIPDEIDAVNSDLDVAMPIYGGSLDDNGENKNLPALYTNVGSEDNVVGVDGTTKLYQDFLDRGVNAAMDVFEGAGHGYGVGQEGAIKSTPECATWPGIADAFMQANLGHSTAPSYTVEELFFYRDGLKIYGQLAMPRGEGPFPLVILSHGYGGNYRQSISMAERFAAAGVAAYAFDFNGGGRSSSSEGDSRDMSVLTEAADLMAILDGFIAMPEIDADNIFLYGASQGGFVSTYVAATRPDDVKALVAMYPAYVIHDDAEKNAPDLESLPDEFDFMGMTISPKYWADAKSFSIYDMMPNYTNDVLIFHGTRDTLVPIDYSQRAAGVFPSVELVTVEGGAHGNLGTEVDDRAIAFILEHIDN